ncbi:HEPN domain-containing protein [Pseudomonas sp. Sample_10]|uniref:HEPN domain-containing protein n=1 Tax=Pseudomonas sp. Sample_10 TaxID=2448269 RepID=UPI001035CCB6|nr:HEPN domain-containing protein [Pseudomonas sp. Sample_10]
MLDKVTELELGKEYFFDVVYREGDAGYAATLHLTPELIKFKVTSERRFELTWGAVEATCEDFHNVFMLKGLYCIASKFSTINHSPYVGLYEAEFTVECVLFCPGSAPEDGEFESLDIFSTTVNDWVGYTTTQQKIFEVSYKRETVEPFLIEFSAVANDSEEIGVKYNGKYRQSHLLYEQGFMFPPSLFYLFGLKENASDPFSTYTRIYNILAFLTGVEPSVQTIVLGYDSHGFAQKGSLYCLNNSLKPKRNDTYAMFPLGKDPRFEDWGIAPFPLSSFALYFAPESELSDLLGKYVKYRNMGNVEDRLLGYFRLLEKHCYNRKYYLEEGLFTRFNRIAKGWVKGNSDLTAKQIKSFEGGLKRFNGQKYNTEKCVTDFLRSLPEPIQKGLGVTTELLTEICTLRNNITHANKYHIEETKLHVLTAYIHHLLIFAILDKLKVDLTGVANLTGRLRNF